MGRNSDGRETEIKGGVRWESSDKRVATVNPKGEVIGRREGTVDIVARSGHVASKPLTLVIKASVKRGEAQTARGISSDKIAELNGFIRTAKSYRERGDLCGGLGGTARSKRDRSQQQRCSVPDRNHERACNAERTLGRSELKC